MQPGQSITPGYQPDPSNISNSPVPPTPQPPVSSPDPYEQPPQQQTSDEVTWTASEYIAHDKSMMWFVALGLGLFVFIGLVYLLTKDIFASVLVGLAGITFGIFAARPPRVLRYSIHPGGVSIGPREFLFSDFKSFAINDEGPVPSVMLMPLKRFLPPITIFYDPQSEDAILTALSDYLPHEDKTPDIVDRLMGRIRF